MNWISGLQNAIDYIEDNLTFELDYNEIARRAYSSPYHFQRVFSILCGCTIGEYIRSRRLTLAGGELSAGETKVIDAALKYGYDSPESFARAFTRFHGVTPSQAKREGTSLKSYSALSVKLILQGGSIMDYRLEKKDAFRVVVRKRDFTTNLELAQGQIPSFWDECNSDGTIEKLCECMDETGVFGRSIVGMCFENKTENNMFPYAIGAAYNGGVLPSGLCLETVPAHTWAIFQSEGAMPMALQDLMKRIYSEFFPASDYQPCGGMDIEVYPKGDLSSPNYKCEIWIAVEKTA